MLQIGFCCGVIPHQHDGSLLDEMHICFGTMGYGGLRTGRFRESITAKRTLVQGVGQGARTPAVGGRRSDDSYALQSVICRRFTLTDIYP